MTREELYRGQELVDMMENIRRKKAWLDKKITEDLMSYIDSDKETKEQINTILADVQCKITNYLTSRLAEFEEELKNI